MASHDGGNEAGVESPATDGSATVQDHAEVSSTTTPNLQEAAAEVDTTPEEAACNFFTCDICQKTAFDTLEALIAHVDSKHDDLLPERLQLQAMADKVRPVYTTLLSEHTDRWAAWGKQTFEVAKHRDAGPTRLAEACAARAQMEAVVREWNPNATVFIFGSSVVMGLWDGLSDIDMTVVDVELHDKGQWPPSEKLGVRALTQILRRAGFSFNSLEPIEGARVPIIKHHGTSPQIEFLEKSCEQTISRSVRFIFDRPLSNAERILFEAGITEASGHPEQLWWDSEGKIVGITMKDTLSCIRALVKTPALINAHVIRSAPLHDEFRPELYRIDFDLSFRSFGIRNSLLLREYLNAHPCGRPGALVLKEWSKACGVNNSVMGFFTSYAVNIMWIYYLVRKGVVPYVHPGSIPSSLVGASCDPKYRPLVPPDMNEEQQAKLMQECGSLLVGFFAFYCFEFNWKDHVISLNRPGITTKAELHWTAEDEIRMAKPGKNVRYVLCIEDPYEENLNLGRHLGECKTRKVVAEFQRALVSLLKDTLGDCCVFGSVEQDTLGGGLDDPDNNALVKLMGIAVRTIEGSSGPVLHKELRAAFTEQEPQALEAVLKFWSWKRLIQKLGYRIVGDKVMTKRGIGGRATKKIRDPAKEDAATPQPTGTHDLTEQLVAEYLEEQRQYGNAVNPEWIVWTPPVGTVPGHRLAAPTITKACAELGSQIPAPLLAPPVHEAPMMRALAGAQAVRSAPQLLPTVPPLGTFPGAPTAMAAVRALSSRQLLRNWMRNVL